MPPRMTPFQRMTMVVLAAAGIVAAGCQNDREPLAPEEAELELSREGGGQGQSQAAENATRIYEVTIENLTDGQPFSPGVVVTHTRQASVWQVGSPASALLVNIAEDGLSDENVGAGVPEMLIAGLASAPGIHQVVATEAPVDDNTPPLLEGAPDPPAVLTRMIEAAANADRLSIAVMIICTNDGFTGVSGVKLPGGFQPVTFETIAYDAGSEPNTEVYSDIVDPCQLLGPDTGPPAVPNDNDTPEGDTGVIRVHPGIAGVATAMGLDPALHDQIGWAAGAAPVARITVQRMK